MRSVTFKPTRRPTSFEVYAGPGNHHIGDLILDGIDTRFFPINGNSTVYMSEMKAIVGFMDRWKDGTPRTKDDGRAQP